MDAARRHYPVALSAEVLALAWARQEAAAAGSVVVVDHEISPRGRLGRLWPHPPEQTAALAMVWRPAVGAEAADLLWSAASLALLQAVDELLGGERARLWYPDEIHDGAGRLLGAVRAEAQLGPGGVTSAVLTARIDLEGVGRRTRRDVLATLEGALTTAADQLELDPTGVRSACDRRSALLGQRAIAHLLPKGEVRGVAGGIDVCGALELVSATGLRQRVPVVGLDRLSVVER